MLLLFIHHRLRSDEVSRLAEAHGAASQGGVIASFKSAFEAAPHHGHVAHYFAATNRRALSEFSRYELAHIASVNSDAVALTAAPGTRWALLTHLHRGGLGNECGSSSSLLTPGVGTGLAEVTRTTVATNGVVSTTLQELPVRWE